MSGARAQILSLHVHSYSHVVVQPHQADPVHSQDAVARSQPLALSRRRTRNQRLDVNAAHPQLGFLGEREREKDEDVWDSKLDELQTSHPTIPSTSARPSP